MILKLKNHPNIKLQQSAQRKNVVIFILDSKFLKFIFTLFFLLISQPIAAQDESNLKISNLAPFPGSAVDTGMEVIEEYFRSHNVSFESRSTYSNPLESWKINNTLFWSIGWDGLFRQARRNMHNSFWPFLSLEDAKNFNFDLSYLVWDDSDRIYRLGAAWIPFDEDEVKDVGDCGPPEDWRDRDNNKTMHCIETDDRINYTVHMKFGHSGFPVLELAGSQFWMEMSSEDEIDAQLAIVGHFAADDLAVELSKSWLLTSIDNGRKVTFKLYKPGSNTAYREASGEKAKPGKMISDGQSDSGEHNTCGGTQLACPIFFDPENYNEMADFIETLGSFESGSGWSR